MMELPDRLMMRASEVLGNDYSVSRAPGRVEVLGNHTDYNGGLVLAATIDRFVWSIGTAADDVTIESLNFEETTTFGPKDLKPTYHNHWDDYVKGIYWALSRRGHMPGGLRAVIFGDVPIGSGLSSSAALEVSVANLVRTVHSIDISAKALAMIAFEAERLFCNVSCGVMDQFTSQLGRPDSLIAIQCSSMQVQHIAVPTEGQFVIVDSMVSREAKDVLNQRREECRTALRTLQSHGWNIATLSAIRWGQVPQILDLLDDKLQLRVRHVIDENTRVQEGIRALKTGDLRQFGQIMNRSHDSSRDLYEVSHPRLDMLVAMSREIEGVLGSRLSGAGLGGSIISLVKANRVKDYIKTIGRKYEQETGTRAVIRPIRIPGGAVTE